MSNDFGAANTMFAPVGGKSGGLGFVKDLYPILDFANLESWKNLFRWSVHTKQLPGLRSSWKGNIHLAEEKA